MLIGDMAIRKRDLLPVANERKRLIKTVLIGKLFTDHLKGKS
ncbi:hypothetical protein NEOC65_001854 [Neochlamydia sp. AcF65]|nr:hypothetical protein [Neochlamydia sp. AcF65]MBS4169791.1 hypothetical protein [Neochlamydia sp. AcF95]